MNMNRWMLAAIPAAICSIQVMAAPAWNSATVYSGGEIVTYAGQDYKAKWWTQGNIPGTEQWGPWELQTSGGVSTPVPTAVPTTAPTATPAVTAAPTSTPKPTATPTAAPTTTAAPTATPKPTTAPTATPATNCPSDTWLAATAYSGGQTVVYKGNQYKAQWWTQNEQPDLNTGAGKPWLLTATLSCGTGTPVPTTAPTATPVATATAKPTATPVATPTAVPTATPVATATPAATATPGPVAAYKPQITYVAAPAGYPTDAKFSADEAALASQAGTDAGAIARIHAALRVLPDAQVEAVTIGGASNPDNVKRVERVLGQAKFEALFPIRHINYTYLNFLKGVAKFPAYCDNYTDGRNADAICSKLLATSFAHFTQETGANWPALTPATARTYPEHNNAVLATMEQNTAIPTYKQALWYLRESGYNEGSAVGAYQDCFSGAGSSIFSVFYPCSQNAQGKNIDYFGRGSKQLSWNYNFGPFSKSLYGDVNVLLDNPGRVADTWLNFASAIWFAVYPQSPKPPMTWVVDGTWVPNAVDVANNMSPGFGATVHIINGGIECGGGGAEKSQVQNRIAAYKEFARELGVTIPANEALGCAAMKGFQPGSAASTKTYLDKAWNYNANNPGGVSWACQLVDYQMPFSLANPGDYKACVDYMFRGQVKFNGAIVIDNTK
jgi:chitodextrinase